MLEIALRNFLIRYLQFNNFSFNQKSMSQNVWTSSYHCLYITLIKFHSILQDFSHFFLHISGNLISPYTSKRNLLNLNKHFAIYIKKEWDVKNDRFIWNIKYKRPKISHFLLLEGKFWCCMTLKKKQKFTCNGKVKEICGL